MPTDREIVEVLAEKVMGWERREVTHVGHFRSTQIGKLTLWPEDDPHIAKMEGWNPLESWADAGMVAEMLAAKLESEDYGLRIDVLGDSAYTFVIGRFGKEDPEDGPYRAPKGPRAISLAAYEWAKQQTSGDSAKAGVIRAREGTE